MANKISLNITEIPFLFNPTESEGQRMKGGQHRRSWRRPVGDSELWNLWEGSSSKCGRLAGFVLQAVKCNKLGFQMK